MTETPTQTLLTFRDAIRSSSPPWLQRGLAEKILYTFGVHVDGYADALTAGVKSRFPGLYTFEALPIIGRERRIPRGLTESDAAYAARLARFFTDHQLRGGPYALLSQLFIHYSPAAFPIDLVYYAAGRRFAMDVDGNVERDLTSWNPDTNTAKWARWWLFYYTDEWAIDPPTDSELQDLRLIPRQWNAGHPLGYIVLFSSDAELWGWPPGHLWGESGTWGTDGTARFYEVEPTS